MIEQARVLEIHTDEVILACREDACAACKASMFCNPKARTFSAKNSKTVHLAPNDMVEVYLAPKQVISSGFMVLILPLLFFLAAYAIASKGINISEEILNVLIGFIGLAAGFLVTLVYYRRRKQLDYPEIIRRLD